MKNVLPIVDGIPVPESGCFVWEGAVTATGYGVLRRKGVNYYAHRVAWEQAHGAIPEKMHVCHKCDTPSCVNPAHLFLGTHQDNHLDKIRKGRGRGGRLQGEKHPSHKLTDADIVNIRAIYKHTNASQTLLASMYGVGQAQISSIVRGEAWKHVAWT